MLKFWRLLSRQPVAKVSRLQGSIILLFPPLRGGEKNSAQGREFRKKEKKEEKKEEKEKGEKKGKKKEKGKGEKRERKVKIGVKGRKTILKEEKT